MDDGSLLPSCEDNLKHTRHPPAVPGTLLPDRDGEVPNIEMELRMDLLRITNWNQHFENNRTRAMKYMEWVPLPNKQDGDGYTELLDHPNGAAHFGAWVAMVQLASKCDVRGTLDREIGLPHDASSIGRITRIPKKIYAEVIPRLIEIGWVEIVPSDDSRQGADKIRQDTDVGVPDSDEAQEAGDSRSSSAVPGSDYGTERNGTERKQNGTERNGTHTGRAGEQLDTVSGKELKPTEIREATDRVVTHYRIHHPRASPGDKERKLIVKRLKEGFSIKDLQEAIDGNHRDPHCCGENERGRKYQTLELIMRDSSQVQKYIEVPVNQTVLSEKTRRGQRAAQSLLEKEFGDAAKDTAGNIGNV